MTSKVLERGMKLRLIPMDDKHIGRMKFFPQNRENGWIMRI